MLAMIQLKQCFPFRVWEEEEEKKKKATEAEEHDLAEGAVEDVTMHEMDF